MTASDVEARFTYYFLAFARAGANHDKSIRSADDLILGALESHSPPDTDVNLWKCGYCLQWLSEVNFLLLKPSLIAANRREPDRYGAQKGAAHMSCRGKNASQLLSARCDWVCVPYSTLQGLKRSSTSTQAAKRLEAYMGLHLVLLPEAVTRRSRYTRSETTHTMLQCSSVHTGWHLGWWRPLKHKMLCEE